MSTLRTKQRPLQVAGFLLLVSAFAITPPMIGGYLPQQLTGYLIFGLLALSVGLITGYARLFNIGVGATFGISAYTVAILTQHGVTNPLLLFLGAMLSGLLVSILFGIYAIVASGIQYMMLTFLTTLACFSLPKLAPGLTGGDNGLAIKGDLGISFGFNPLLGSDFYRLVLAAVAICLALSWYVLASQAGMAVRAIGRNPVRAAAMGYPVSSYRMALTLFSGFIAAVAGWLYALQSAFVFEDLLGLGYSLNGLLYALIGGVSSILGPLLGAGALRWLTETAARHSTQSSLYIGLILLLVVYFLPEGFTGLVQRLWMRLRLRHVEPRATLEADELEAAAIGRAADDAPVR